MMEKSIILIGMPGCGKTAVGKRLSGKTGLPLCDTDRIVETDFGMAIPDIFSEYGEERFRKLETEALKKALSRPRCIISCGGGIVLREENRELLRQGFTVFIKRPLDKLAKKGRPLSESRDLKDIYDERIRFYEECADIEISNDGRIGTAADSIINKI